MAKKPKKSHIPGVKTCNPEWMSEAKCKNVNPEWFYAEGESRKSVSERMCALIVCSSCPVRTLCLNYSLVNNIEHGIWGGMLWHNRKQILRGFPAVVQIGSRSKRLW